MHAAASTRARATAAHCAGAPRGASVRRAGAPATWLRALHHGRADCDARAHGGGSHHLRRHTAPSSPFLALRPSGTHSSPRAPQPRPVHHLSPARQCPACAPAVVCWRRRRRCAPWQSGPATAVLKHRSRAGHTAPMHTHARAAAATRRRRAPRKHIPLANPQDASPRALPATLPIVPPGGLCVCRLPFSPPSPPSSALARTHPCVGRNAAPLHRARRRSHHHRHTPTLLPTAARPAATNVPHLDGRLHHAVSSSLCSGAANGSSRRRVRDGAGGASGVKVHARRCRQRGRCQHQARATRHGGWVVCFWACHARKLPLPRAVAWFMCARARSLTCLNLALSLPFHGAASLITAPFCGRSFNNNCVCAATTLRVHTHAAPNSTRTARPLAARQGGCGLPVCVCVCGSNRRQV